MWAKAWMALEWSARGVPTLWNSAAEYLCVIGLGRDNLRLGSKLFQNSRNSFEGSSRTEARHPLIEALTGKVSQDLLCGRS